MRFEWTINAGHVLQAAALTIGIAASFYAVDKRSSGNEMRIAVIEADMQLLRAKLDAQNVEITGLQISLARKDEQYGSILAGLEEVKKAMQEARNGLSSR